MQVRIPARPERHRNVFLNFLSQHRIESAPRPGTTQSCPIFLLELSVRGRPPLREEDKMGLFDLETGTIAIAIAGSLTLIVLGRAIWTVWRGENHRAR